MNDATLSRPSVPALTAIGIVRTPFTQIAGTPIQGATTCGEGIVEVFPEFADGLRDLDGFDRVWLIYFFDRAVEAHLAVRPYLDDCERGVFATRSPARPNHLGLCAVRLLRVEGRRLFVSGLDMIDGTPLIDIKPYVPEFDAFAVERTGWYAGKSACGVVADRRFERQDEAEHHR